MANATSRPQGKISCLFQYCWIVSLYILLYNSHTRFIHTGFHTKIKIKVPPYFSLLLHLPLSSLHTTCSITGELLLVVIPT